MGVTSVMRFPWLTLVLILTSTAMGGQTLLPAHSRGFLKNLTVESFGISGSALAEGYEFSPGLDSAFYNLHHLVCPLCTPGRPASRTRALLQPFGANAFYALWSDRLTLFSSFGGIDAVPGDNMPRLNPGLMRATSFNDDWIVTSDVGANVAVDPHKHLSFGYEQGHSEESGPLRNRWNSKTGSMSVSPALFRELAHGVKKLQQRSQDAPEEQP